MVVGREMKSCERMETFNYGLPKRLRELSDA